MDVIAFKDLPLKRGLLKKITPLLRYDYMDDHSDGSTYLTDGDPASGLTLTDYRRHRATFGLTLSLAKPFISDIRINYELYGYPDGGSPKTSEKDKFVIEFMTRF